MVTAETAMALGALVVVTVSLAWVVSVVGLQMRCVDAARDAARAAARGEPLAASRAEAMSSVPDDAHVEIRRRAERVEVAVTASAWPSWRGVVLLPPVEVNGHATVAVEPGVSEDVAGAGS